jgi:hypothetical protein
VPGGAPQILKAMSQRLADLQAAHSPITFKELAARYPTLSPPVIEGLLRVGETGNIIAATKVGKTHAVHDVGLAVAAGRSWLGTFDVAPGNVLIIDNELHPATIATRVRAVASARGILTAEYEGRLFFYALRGRLKDLHALAPFFSRIQPAQFKLVIIDAWYRLLPADVDENSNGQIAGLYNLLDNIAARLQCAFLCVHHASKGIQGAKALTDIGAGAGAQSRAADAHLVLRQHEEEGVVVLDAAVRSWAPIKPICLRWTYPVWNPALELDPTHLKTERPRKRKAKDNEDAKPTWTPASFIEKFVGESPKTRDEILYDAETQGVSERVARRLLNVAVDGEMIHKWDGRRKAPHRYATTAEPKLFNDPSPKKQPVKPGRRK